MAAAKFKVGDYVIVSHVFDNGKLVCQYVGRVIETFKRKRYVTVELIASKNEDGYRNLAGRPRQRYPHDRVEKVANPALFELVMSFGDPPSTQD